MSKSFQQGYVDMMPAKNEGLDNQGERMDVTYGPTTFHRRCEEEPKPAIAT